MAYVGLLLGVVLLARGTMTEGRGLLLLLQALPLLHATAPSGADAL